MSVNIVLQLTVPPRSALAYYDYAAKAADPWSCLASNANSIPTSYVGRGYTHRLDMWLISS